MQMLNSSGILIENIIVSSRHLKRDVELVLYLPGNFSQLSRANLLLINDGQDLKELQLKKILVDLYAQKLIQPILAIGIYASKERKTEYGIASQTDYLGQGAKAGLYAKFVVEELLPYMRKMFKQIVFTQTAFAGFSLGGLTALDIVWNHPEIFSAAGIFSGSLWWRSVDQDAKEYDDDQHRIMHQQIKKGSYKPGLKFFFTTGSLDETRDRNNNGVIDSIDDTMSLISHLEKLGYKYGEQIRYINYPGGKHDITTWSIAMPEFLKWIFGNTI
jgi:enterochelin esterase-like enzyme